MEKYGQTEVHPVALLLTLAMGVAMLVIRRDRAVVPLLFVACLITHAQRIVVGGLDFSMLRLIILFGWARVLLRGEAKHYRFHPLDAALPLWQTMATLGYVFGPRASIDGFVMRLGLTLDAAGTYFLFRVLLRDVRDVRRTVGAFGWMALLMIGPMIVENLTGRNVFAVLGGVSQISEVRDGRIRCQAAFSHPIMAGNFGASTAALLGALWLGYPKRRILLTAAALAAAGITVLSASSGPLMAFLAAALGWALWPARRHMRVIRWTTAAALIVIHFAREKPLWHLIGRLSSITGGTGWHRYRIIDEFINRFGEWWLAGTYTTEHWDIPFAARDITNQYVIEGVRSGLGALLSFVAVLVVAFRAVGESLRLAQAERQRAPREALRAALLAWALGVCLAAHSVAFIGVSYFGQLMALFYLHLAMIPSLARALSRNRRPAILARRSGGAEPETARIILCSTMRVLPNYEVGTEVANLDDQIALVIAADTGDPRVSRHCRLFYRSPSPCCSSFPHPHTRSILLALESRQEAPSLGSRSRTPSWGHHDRFAWGFSTRWKTGYLIEGDGHPSAYANSPAGRMLGRGSCRSRPQALDPEPVDRLGRGGASGSG